MSDLTSFGRCSSSAQIRADHSSDTKGTSHAPGTMEHFFELKVSSKLYHYLVLKSTSHRTKGYRAALNREDQRRAEAWQSARRLAALPNCDVYSSLNVVPHFHPKISPPANTPVHPSSLAAVLLPRLSRSLRDAVRSTGRIKLHTERSFLLVSFLRIIFCLWACAGVSEEVSSTCSFKLSMLKYYSSVRLQANLYCPEIRSCKFASIEDEQRNSQLMVGCFVPSSCRPGILLAYMNMVHILLVYVKYQCSSGFSHDRQPPTRRMEGSFHSSAFGHGCTKQQWRKGYYHTRSSVCWCFTRGYGPSLRNLDLYHQLSSLCD